MGQFEDIFMKMHQKLLILQGTDTGRWEPLGQKGWQGKNNKNPSKKKPEKEWQSKESESEMLIQRNHGEEQRKKLGKC